MLSMEMEEQVKKKCNMAAILWASFTVSVLLYGFFAFLIKGKLELTKSDIDINMLITILVAASFVSAVLSFFMEKRLSGTDAIIKSIQASGNKNVTDVCAQIQLGMITSFACKESIAIYGLILFILDGGRNPILYAYFGLPSLFLFLLAFPSFDKWKNIVEEVSSGETLSI